MNTKPLKHYNRLSLFSSILCLIVSLFLLYPIFWLILFVSSILKNSSNLNQEALNSIFKILGLTILTISKIALSITSIVFSCKIRKEIKANQTISTKKLLVLAIILLTLSVLSIIGLLLKLEIEFLLWIEIVTITLTIISGTLILIEYFKRKQQLKTTTNKEED